MDTVITRERKKFMNRKLKFLIEFCLAIHGDLLDKRKSYQISLRREKVDTLISTKRRLRLKEQKTKIQQQNSQSYRQSEACFIKEFLMCMGHAIKSNEGLIVILICLLIIQFELNQRVCSMEKSWQNQNLIAGQLNEVRILIQSLEQERISVVIDKTNLLQLIDKILRREFEMYEYYLQKKYIVNILVELSLAKDQDLKKLLDKKYKFLSYMSKFTFLNAHNLPMLETGLWFMGNVTTDSNEARELIIQQTNVIQLIESTIIEQDYIHKNLFETICWVVSNLLKYDRLDEKNFISLCNVANVYLDADSDKIMTRDILISMAKQLSYRDKQKIRILEVQNSFQLIMEKFIESFNQNNMMIILPSLKCIGHIISTSQEKSIVEKYTQFDILNIVINILMNNKNSQLFEDALQTLSYLATGLDSATVKSLIQQPMFDQIMIIAKNGLRAQKQKALMALIRLFQFLQEDSDMVSTFATYKNGIFIQALISQVKLHNSQGYSVMVKVLRVIIDILEQNSRQQLNMGRLGDLRGIFIQEGAIEIFEEIAQNDMIPDLGQQAELILDYLSGDQDQEMKSNNSNGSNKGSMFPNFHFSLGGEGTFRI
ncbi:importin subunit alpha-8 [Stylonychia lemnae]|uniref:Importin subunit alpha-8 n=1 Tax=Stylonychia lemnae TaxID=5949 RepID=A0A077ZS21_STYLE|nr:importin subunit alpha-8 [Stylonychia lemnae]|eukprot:CDW71271.1 importin subunit alpha-8 [Stylonychia lemnae]